MINHVTAAGSSHVYELVAAAVGDEEPLAQCPPSAKHSGVLGVWSEYRTPLLVAAFVVGTALWLWLTFPCLFGCADASDGPLTCTTLSSPFNASFGCLFSYAHATCSNRSENVVRPRYDDVYTAITERVSPYRRWSVNDRTYYRPRGLPLCGTAEEVRLAVKLGQRVEGERGSYFVPHGCALRWLSSEDICALFSRFAYVQFLGDSLTRHMTQGLFALLSMDLLYGALPRLSPQLPLYERCQCDGQFSENLDCRTFGWDHMFALDDYRKYGVCSTAHDWRFQYGEGSDFQWLCTTYDPRPRFVFLQGGTHTKTSASATVEKFIAPALSSLRQRVEQRCGGPIYVVWSGVGVQNRALDVKYPMQSRELAAVFNDETREYLQRANVSVLSLDFWNLTLDAETSDGFHGLTDVNMMKALALLNVMQHVDTMTPY